MNEIERIVQRLQRNKLILHYFITGFLIVGLILFLNSNRLLNKKYNIINTDVNTNLVNQNLNVHLSKKEYNPNNRLIKFNIKVKLQIANQEIPIRTELVEKSNLGYKIPNNLVKVDKENYVIYATLPEKWTTVSLKVIEDIKDSNNPKFVKIYADSRDINIKNDLIEKKESELEIETIENEIESINQKINEKQSVIEEKKLLIEKEQCNLADMEKDKKYQTENEINETNTEIDNKRSTIEFTRLQIGKLEDESNELRNKISKLEVKKNDLR
ncbi:hypothetical protein FDE76_15105 [Clostridium botulinum]|uniref:Uncharacterized protein n=2 Tax=Clostridium botulinum TaxID=1491 RepID=A0A0A0USS0_CLOBO|nr:hypothetical protein [Clostridium botulinum]ACD14158.1 conserved hypothetical protein [Clostridium botulinum B str. Eklund 17B (NRP)]AIW54497.1 hypothetical protein [Clostridium botulinum]AIW54551.1 hypothetical protein [Clostridium botulinum]AIW54801.1 hypothetical protein [Clostridium botulinum]MBY6977825.1 hypothetical protein [Clostridium botulinum]